MANRSFMDLLWANTGLTGHVIYTTLLLINPLVKVPHWPRRGIVGNLIDMCKYIIFSVKGLVTKFGEVSFFFSNLRSSKHHPLATWNIVSYHYFATTDKQQNKLSTFCKRTHVWWLCYFTLNLDKKPLLLYSIFKQKHSTMCGCLPLYEFESHWYIGC